MALVRLCSRAMVKGASQHVRVPVTVCTPTVPLLWKQNQLLSLVKGFSGSLLLAAMVVPEYPQLARIIIKAH